MIKLTKIIAVILSLILILSACSPAGTETTQNATDAPTTEEITTEEITTEGNAASTGQTEESTESTEQTEGEPLSPEEQILEDRRNAVVEAMRSMVTVLWRAEEDIDYSIASGAKFSIKQGRIYRGMPYTNACGTLASFLEYAGAPDENGIVTISGLKSGAMSGGGAKTARIGNDCSSTVTRAWSVIGASIQFNISASCCEDKGAVKVGEYETDPSTSKYTGQAVITNGREVMGAAYAKLQKGDALVRSGEGGNHMMMVVGTDVFYDKDGKVDLKKSIVTILEQTSSRVMGNKFYYDEKLGENVYEIGGVEIRYSFLTLYEKDYLPFTCKELIDPSPVEAPYVTDSEETYTLDSIFVGTISSNWFIDSVTVTVKDTKDNIVQEATGRVSRNYNRAFNLQQFLTDPADSIKGKVDPNELAAGQYKCVVVCRLTSGQELVAREFVFTK